MFGFTLLQMVWSGFYISPLELSVRFSCNFPNLFGTRSTLSGKFDSHQLHCFNLPFCLHPVHRHITWTCSAVNTSGLSPAGTRATGGSRPTAPTAPPRSCSQPWRDTSAWTLSRSALGKSRASRTGWVTSATVVEHLIKMRKDISNTLWYLYYESLVHNNSLRRINKVCETYTLFLKMLVSPVFLDQRWL